MIALDYLAVGCEHHSIQRWILVSELVNCLLLVVDLVQRTPAQLVQLRRCQVIKLGILYTDKATCPVRCQRAQALPATALQHSDNISFAGFLQAPQPV